jgi:hypothetical protein
MFARVASLSWLNIAVARSVAEVGLKVNVSVSMFATGTPVTVRLNVPLG